MQIPQSDILSTNAMNRRVFPLFSRNEKSATRISSKLLIIRVDQIGLKPMTSRLRVLQNR